MNNKILIFIPVFNCEKQIVRVLKNISESKLDFIEEILVVDNISSDNTIRNAMKCSNLFNHIKFSIIQNKKNINLGGSHKTAIKYAQEKNYSHLIILHGDDQANINDISNLIKNKSTTLMTIGF